MNYSETHSLNLGGVTEILDFNALLPLQRRSSSLSRSIVLPP